jgi:CHASE3 domain sensor protein
MDGATTSGKDGEEKESLVELARAANAGDEEARERFSKELRARQASYAARENLLGDEGKAILSAAHEAKAEERSRLAEEAQRHERRRREDETAKWRVLFWLAAALLVAVLVAVALAGGK